MVHINKIKTKVNLNKLQYNNNKKIGEGSFGAVYNLHNNKRTNKKYVAKKVKNNWGLKLISFLATGKTQTQQLNQEVGALIKLSKLGISPKIFYYNKENMVYVIEKLDYNLHEMIKKKMIKPKHINKLIEVLKKLQETNIKHNDLHSGNIMYSKSKNKFYIIDLGLFEVLNECENGTIKKVCYNFEKRNAELLSDLIYYIKGNINSKTTSKKIKSEYVKAFKSLVDLFNIYS
jgi:predicted Ser/Thr protein kinase